MASYLSGFEHLEIQLEEIKTATNNFHNSKVIGVGGFGKVYKGELSYPEGKRMVAFKRLDRKHGQGDPEFFKEIRMLSTYKHDNLISLLGFCKEGDEMILDGILCGRVCYENSNRQFKIFVPYWKICYEQKKLDEIIFPNLKQQMDPSSVGTFVDIAYQCLQKSREQRPTMSVAVEKLKAALEFQEHYDLKLQRESEVEQIRKAAEYEAEQMRKAAEYEAEQMRKAAEYEYKEILKSADPPRFFEFPVNGAKRFPLGHCYYKHKDELKVQVRAQFLYPRITYSLNLVFRKALERLKLCKTLHYKLNGETKFCMVYDTYEREDGWFVVPLYQFTSDHETADFEIYFEGFRYGSNLRVAGFEFRPLEEKVELHNQGFEEYQDIVKAASQSLFYKSIEELKMLLSKGFHINNYKTWFSLNENGEHCEMLSIADCLIFAEGGYDFYHNELDSRFPRFYYTKEKGFKVHIRTQFLTPLIDYTVNLVFCKGNTSEKTKYVALRYKLEGETETSIVYIATTTKDNCSFIAELYQFTSNGKTFDLEIVFEDHKDDLKVEGILFQPLEKVEHEQVLEEEKLSNNSLKWTMKEEDLCTNLFKWFHIYTSQEVYALDKNGRKCIMLSARGVLRSDKLSFKYLPESRFGEVAVINYNHFYIQKKIKCDAVTPCNALTPQTTYACYLVYKTTKDQPVLRNLYADSYIYLVSPKETPIIGQNLDQNTHTPLNRPKLNVVPRQGSDGWMEVRILKFVTPRTTETIDIHIALCNPDNKDIRGLIIQSIVLRPIVAHSS